ncbi:sensor histidine kinase [Rhizobium rhizosphaerae]|uniref:sensor histidine kinase n=1 Tax=Xaviernesmea rhizosphaerae TaxID=1672749 RepID=UPI0009BD1ADF|nr:HAMP domain-containing sensor histidine kinase [Xaviernesmea rhizosphaerae]
MSQARDAASRRGSDGRADRHPGRSLIGIVSSRIVLFTVLAMLLELGIVLVQYWTDNDELGAFLINEETEILSGGLSAPGGRPRFDLSPQLAERYQLKPAETEGAIYLRVRTGSGRVLFSSCAEACERHFLPVAINPPDFWQRQIAAGKPLSVAGGRTFRVGEEEVFVELAVLRDPHDFVNRVLAHELRDHLIIPMPLMFGLVAIGTILSVWAALKPVVAAGRAADQIDPRADLSALSTEGMPREVATFVHAVNRLLARVRDLIQAQKVFSTSIAHEIRTPVSIIRMELERIDDPRARKAERDLEALTHMLEQLTALAKLDVVDPKSFQAVDLFALAEESVARLAPFVFANGHSIELVGEGAPMVRAVPALLENMLRNLVENAVKHTPAGTNITIQVLEEGALKVSDDGPGFEPQTADTLEAGRIKSSDQLGIGLRIVERIAALHQGRLSVESAPGQGTRIRLDLNPA